MISIITPTHDPKWLPDAWRSLKAQRGYDGEWEWIVMPNGDGELSVPESVSGPEIRVVPFAGDSEGKIGAIKRFCCEQAQGEIVVELDHDDMLTPNALRAVAEAFDKDSSLDFVYSGHAEFHDGTWKPHVYDARYGWETRQGAFYDHEVTEMRGFQPTAHSLSSVHYAPNHLRAWRQKAYWDIGGHDAAMAVCDDHDLCCRFYLHKRMRLIDDCLYLYRMHGDNSYLQRNAEIQRGTLAVMDKYVYALAERWADLEGLPKVDLGAAHDRPAGYVGIDMELGPGVDIVHDVRAGLPFDDGSVGVIRAFDFLEHIPDSVALMNEIYRVLADGGWLLSLTPSTDGRGAFQDPTHVSFFNENSFFYYTNRFYAAYVSAIACRFQAVRLKTDFPSQFHRDHKIPYVYADLAAVKSWRRRPGLVEC